MAELLWDKILSEDLEVEVMHFVEHLEARMVAHQAIPIMVVVQVEVDLMLVVKVQHRDMVPGNPVV